MIHTNETNEKCKQYEIYVNLNYPGSASKYTLLLKCIERINHLNSNTRTYSFHFRVLKSENAFLNFLASSLGYVQSVLDKLHVNILLIQSSKLQVSVILFKA